VERSPSGRSRMQDIRPPGEIAGLSTAAKALAGFTYDAQLASVYDVGQASEPETLELWIQRFKHHARRTGQQSVLDLGCGTGVFAPALAEGFGGPVFAVEPSDHMRAVAERSRPHPRVRYLKGSAEAIPLPDTSCDLVLMFLVLQHVVDREAAAREVRRVLKSGGILLVAGRYRGEPTPRAWSRYFPRADEIELESLPTLKEAESVFAAAQLDIVAVERVRFVVSRSMRSYVERIKLRPISAFRHLSEEEFAAGLAALEAEAADEELPRPVYQEANLLVFRRPAEEL
jgi:ubiquinone/menaquinone biosynthesis C-methylase UbiE